MGDVYDILTELMLLVDNDLPQTPIVTTKLHALADSVSVGGPEIRQAVLDLGAYSIITRAWATCCSSGVQNVPSPSPGASECREAVIHALYAVTAGFPEIIDEICWQIISQALDKTVPEETQILVLKLIRNISIKSEENREMFTWTLGLVEPLASIIATNRPSSQLIREWCACVKALLLSDDPRVPYNRAPERKRVVGRTRILPVVTGHLHHPEYENDEGALNAIVILLGTMAINEEYCVHIESGNVLPGIHAILKNHFQNKTLVRNTISLLRYLCVIPLVREKSSAYSLIKWVVEIAMYHKKEADVVDVAMSCCAFMTLKNACQAGQFVAKNGIQVISQVMNDYAQDITILKGACVTLRNVCENGDEDTKALVKEAGIPAFLKELMVAMPDLKEFHIMPVLRELGEDKVEDTPDVPIEPATEPLDIISLIPDEIFEEEIEGEE